MNSARVKVLIDALKSRTLGPTNSRELRIVECQVSEREDYLAAFTQTFHQAEALAVSKLETPVRSRVAFNQVSQYLGQEFNHVLFDGFSGLQPNILGQLSGLVKGGGCLIVLMPPRALWYYFDDPEWYKVNSYFANWRKSPSLFIQHLQLVLKTHKQNELAATKAQAQDLAVQEQNALLAELENDFCSSRKHCVAIVSAERGRGKSSLLGKLATKLLRSEQKVAISASSKSALVNCFAHIDKTVHGNSHDLFVPLVNLLTVEQDFDVLIVDEAAAIPIETLKQLASKYKRLIMATTLEGYEGTGSGFAHKFIPFVQEKVKALKKYSLFTPLRWPLNDRLEDLMHELLLTRLTFSDEKMIRTSPSAQVETCEHPASYLLQNQETLRRVFSVLLSAHYQTTPNDLRQLLDAGNLRIFVLKADSAIIGVCLVAEEGAWTQNVCEKVSCAQKRYKGELMPQAMLLYSQFPEFAKLKGWRVVRIAVDLGFQGQGLGTQLLNYVERQAINERQDYLATSFALEEALIRFWLKNRFEPIRLGNKKDPVSGHYSISLLKSLSSACDPKPISTALVEHVFYYGASDYRDVDTSLICMILAACLDDFSLSDADRRDLNALATGYKSLSCFGPVLVRGLKYALARKNKNKNGSGINVLCAFVVQGLANRELVKIFQCTDQGEVTRKLRTAIAEITADH